MEKDLRNDRLTAALEQTEADYRERTPQSAAWNERAAGGLPGGNTRTVLHFTPYPLRVVKAQNQWLTDADQNRYRDYLGEYSAAAMMGAQVWP